MKIQENWMTIVVVVSLWAIWLWPATTQGATYQLYSNWALFNAAVANQKTMNDLEAYAPGTNLNNVELISGLQVTSNMAKVVAWDEHPGVNLFGYDDTTRQQGNAFYDIVLSLPYRGVAFDIIAWNPEAPGPAVADIYFSDSSHVALDFYQNGATESTAVFFGITSDTAISNIRWQEGPEIGGSGNEEVALDNFAVSTVPEPTTLLLLGLGGAALVKSRAAK